MFSSAGPPMFSSAGSSVVGFGGGAPMASAAATPAHGEGCCATDSRWGGTRGMCFRPEVVEPNWSYVGAGKGGYEKVETYNYVGEGAGSYDKDFFSQHVIFGWRPRWCCLCLCFGVGLLLLFTLFSPFMIPFFTWAWCALPDWFPWHPCVPKPVPEYLGCYVDDSSRVFNQGPMASGYTVFTCSDACAAVPTTEMALQDGGQCFCGSAESLGIAPYLQVADSQCGEPSATYGSPSAPERGGGFERLAVYTVPQVGNHSWHLHNGLLGDLHNGLNDLRGDIHDGVNDLHRHLKCSAAGKNCTGTKCCKDKAMRCYEKDQNWAGCRKTCVPGIFEEDPPEHRSRWNCLLIDVNGPLRADATTASSTPPPGSATGPFEPWPNVIFEDDACSLDGSTGTCAAGTSCKPGVPTPICVRDAFVPVDGTDPVVDGTAPDEVSTKTTEALTIGDKTVMLEQTTGIVVGSTLTISTAGISETQTIAGLEDGVITLEFPVANPYPAGSDVVITKVASVEPDESGIEPGFEKSNHFTTTRGEIPAGVTEIPVSSFVGFAVGDSILIENLGDPPGEQKEITAVGKTIGDFKLVVRTPTKQDFLAEARVTLLELISLNGQSTPVPPVQLPEVIPEGEACLFDGSTGVCAAGTTCTPRLPNPLCVRDDAPLRMELMTVPTLGPEGDIRAMAQYENEPVGIPEDTDAGMMPMEPATRAGKGRPLDEPAMDIPEAFPEPPKDRKFDCAQGFENLDAGWADDKKYYCCKYYGRGCPPETTTPPKHDCEVEFDDWENKWDNDKQYYCCKYYGRGCPDVPSACDAKCESKGVTLTCSERVQYFATHDFRGQSEACSQGHKQVLDECSVCEECPLQATDCEKKKAEFPYDCDLNFETWQESWSPGEQRWCCDNVGRGCPDPSPLEHLPACSTSCVHDDGTSKTCGEWIQSVAAEDFQGQAGSCQAALGKVLKDCPVCTVCGLEESGCVDAAPDDGQAEAAPPPQQPQQPQQPQPQPPEGTGAAEVDQSDVAPAQQPQPEDGQEGPSSKPFDCSEKVNWEAGWSPAKKTWCCEHENFGC